MNRRDALGVFFGAVVSACACGRAHAQAGAQGCFISAASIDAFSGEYQVQGTTGLDYLDANIEHEADLMRDWFGVWPGLTYFVEPPAMGGNAFATSEKYFLPTQDGTVLMGLRLMQSEMDLDDGQDRITCVMAHEWGHIYQVTKPHLRQMPQRWRELHADYLAGWYMGVRSVEGLQLDVKNFGNTLFSKGDFDFNNPNHHGTPEQRLVMMLEGYVFARNDPGYKSVKNASAAAAARLFMTPDGQIGVIASA